MIIVVIMMDEIKEKDSENSFLFLGITFSLLVLSLFAVVSHAILIQLLSRQPKIKESDLLF